MQTILFIIIEVHQSHQYWARSGIRIYLEDPKNSWDWFRIILQLLFFVSSFTEHNMEVGILIIASVQYETNNVRMRELLFGFIMAFQWLDMLQELRFWKK